MTLRSYIKDKYLKEEGSCEPSCAASPKLVTFESREEEVVKRGNKTKRHVFWRLSRKIDVTRGTET